MELNLKNLTHFTKIIHERILPKIKDKDIVIMMGDSGDGKTTMMASLIYGPENLHCKVEVK